LVVLFLLLAFTACAEDANFVPGRILVKPRPQLPDVELQKRLNAHGASQRHALERSRIHVVALPEEKTEAALAALRRDPDIEFAERDYIAHASLAVNDPYVVAGTEWHLAKIAADRAWDITTGSSSVVVAVLDSGVNAAHPDLVGHLLQGYDFVWNDSDPADDFGHGTAVTGTIVAAGNNGMGVAGVAFGCSVLPVKVMDASGSATHSCIAQGIEYAVQQGARVINLSLGGDFASSTLQDAIDYAWSNNVVVVASAGNSGGTVPQYPAACDHVVGVAATEPDDSKAWFSSYGSWVALFAPGDNIWTTQRDLTNAYGSWAGTSFSSPIVAGVAALVASAKPSLSNTQIANILEQTADDLGAPGFDSTFSYGRVNAFRAVTAAAPQAADQNSSISLGTATPPTVTLAGPTDAAALGDTVSLAATATALSGSVTNVQFFANGAPLSSVSAPPFAVNWTPVQAGSYSIVAVAIDEQGLSAASAPVIVNVVPPDPNPPTLAILAGPVNGARLASGLVTLSGTASDNVGLDHVEVQVNNGPIQMAQGTTSWNASVALVPGVNLIRVRSVDLAGNVSVDAARAVTYVVTAPLVVQTNGWGRMAPSLNGAMLELGRTYSVRAVPGPGQIFAGWSGVASSSPVLSFVMQSNLTLMVNFVPSPFPVVRGTFAGLFADTNGVTPSSSGYVTFNVTPMGAFSGRAQLGGMRYPFHGQFDLTGNAALSLNRYWLPPLALNLHVDLTGGTDQASGSLSDGNWTAVVAADRNVFNTMLNPASRAGKRTFVLQSADPSVGTAAVGVTWIGLNGVTTVRGKLRDGRPFATSSILAKNGDFPFFLLLSRGSEEMIGWLNISASQTPAVSGGVVWINTGTNSFSTQLRASSQ
jgi:subtilisin family serine protease